MTMARSVVRGTRWATLLLLVLVVVAACSPQDIQAYCDHDYLAAAPGMNITDVQWESSAAQSHDLDDAKAAGVRWLRLDVNWDYVQAGGRNSFNFAAQDAVVYGAVARGMKLLLVLDSPTPGWAQSSAGRFAPPAQASDYGNFAFVAAAHFAGEGQHTFEIWNEPNQAARYGPAANTATYTALLKDAYKKIHAVDATATVLAGGLAPSGTGGGNISPIDFLSGIYANGGQGSFDAVATHPYSFPYLASDVQSWNAFSQMGDLPVSLRSVMTSHGDSVKKIWATEGGSTVGPVPSCSGCSVNEAQQSQIIANAYTTFAKYSWAGPMFLYSLRDSGGSSWDGTTGIERADRSHRPSFQAYANAAVNWAYNEKPLPSCH